MDGKPTTLQRVEAAGLSSDANTFQFKSGGDGAGVTDRLSGVSKWNPAAAGKVMVYEYADGRQVIADGHQRLGLAKRLMSQGHEPIKMDAIVLRQQDGWQPRDVRAYAAIKNMHESSGHSLDMARVMRERPDLVTGSLPVSDAKIREARSLARLSEPAFNMVASGTVKPDVAAAVGDAVKDSSRHLDYITEMQKAKVASGQHARLYVQQAMAAPSLTETTGSLFGEETTTRSLLKERAQVLDKALTALKQDKRIFGLLEREAGTIEAVGNRLSHAANAERATGAGRLAEMVEKLSTTRGPISEMLDRAAAAIAKGEAPAKAARAFVKDVGDTMKRGGISALTGNAPSRRQAMVDVPIKRGADRLQIGDMDRMLKEMGIQFSKETSRSMSDRFGPSLSTYYKVQAGSGQISIRVSDHDSGYGRPHDFRLGQPMAMAQEELLRSLGRDVPEEVARAAQRSREESQRLAAERREQQRQELDRAVRATREERKQLKERQAANDKLLADAGLGHLRGEPRKQALLKLKIANQPRRLQEMVDDKPGWSDSARAASADQRGVARPGEAATTKSPGQLAYEQDVAAKPTYHDGGKRKTWAQLGEAEKGTWEKNPTPRFQHKQPESYWSTKAPPTPTVTDLPPGAFKGTEKDFSSLSPGMRREIERAAARANPQPAASFDSREAPKGQTSFIPPPTTKEKISAAVAATGKSSVPQQPMDQGLFGSGMKQLDLVEMAKGKPAGVTYSAEQAERDRVAAGTKRVGDSATDRYTGGMSNHPKSSMATATSTVSIEPVVGPKGTTGEYQIVERHYVGRGEGQREVGKTVYAERYASHDAAFRHMDSASGKNPGWSDAARESSAKARGVAAPGEAKAPDHRVAELAAKQGISMDEAARRVKAMDVFKDVPAQMARIAEAGTKQDARSRAAIKAAETRKANKAKAGGLASAAQSAGVRDPNAAMAKMFGPNLKPSAQPATAASAKPKRSKGSKALAMLGPVAIAGAAAVAFDATRSEAQAAGNSAATANAKAVGAATVAGGTVAAVGWGIGKGLALAAKGAAVVAPRAAAVVVPGGAMVLGGLAAYGAGKAAVEGYKKDGVKGAMKEVGDWATMGAVSHFGPRLTAAGATQFEAADAAYRAMKPGAAEPPSARKPGWGPEARIEAARARGAAVLPYGGHAEKAPGYVPPVKSKPKT